MFVEIGVETLQKAGVWMRYFFNLAGAVYDPDVEGVELPDIVSARLEAVRFSAGELLNRPEIIWKGEEFRVEVTDDKQLVLFTVITLGVDGASVPFSTLVQT